MKLISPKNLRLLRLTMLTLVIAMLSLQTLFFVAIRREIMSEAQDTVTNILNVQQAIRNYVETVLRPETYRLQNQDILDADYFSPELMSRSFVSRKTIDIFSQLHDDSFPDFIFRYASDSPLNLENQATNEELMLINRFDQNNQTEFREIRQISGIDHLFYALPLDRFTSACLHCHGNPEDAPAILTERYGRTHGFRRNVGELSGIMSITLDLTPYKDKSLRAFFLVSAIILIIFITIFILFWKMLLTKDNQDQILLQKNEELDRLSSIDTLTGVWNRLQLDREMIRSMALASRQGTSLAMIVIDLDHFKQVNDNYGHSIGDQVLKCFADFLQKMCRKSDFIARYGGEEFIIVAPQINKKELIVYAERLLENMGSVEYPLGLQLTASLGLAMMQSGEDAKQFFCRADSALYTSKAEGRFRYTLANEAET
jgi:diguanylate cyclase (GGDEF)-like protein